MGIVAGILRFLVILFMVRLALRALTSLIRVPQPHAEPDGPGRNAVELVRDRICNTFFPAPRAVRATIAGEEELFCSAECAQRARLLASS
jgi:hypothetical protein